MRNLLKQITVIIASLMLIFGLCISVQAFSYPGEINPRVIYFWKVVDTSYADANGFYYVLSQNPDPTSAIHYVLFKVYFPHQRMVVRYAYYKPDNSLFVAELIHRRYLQGICEFQEIEISAEEREEIKEWLVWRVLNRVLDEAFVNQFVNQYQPKASD